MNTLKAAVLDNEQRTTIADLLINRLHDQVIILIQEYDCRNTFANQCCLSNSVSPYSGSTNTQHNEKSKESTVAE